MNSQRLFYGEKLVCNDGIEVWYKNNYYLYQISISLTKLNFECLKRLKFSSSLKTKHFDLIHFKGMWWFYFLSQMPILYPCFK